MLTRTLTIQTFLFGLILAMPLSDWAQDTRPAPPNSPTVYRGPVPSDLADENLTRVGASATQLQAVFIKDPGLLVELKRWIAKEAAEYGQVVDDASLTDQGVFDRLERDIAFRAVATRLVQKYGYLLPNLNPNSDIAKEQEVILKERARHIVQVEEKEDTQGLENSDRTLRTGAQDSRFRSAECDSTNPSDCIRPQPKSLNRNDVPGFPGAHRAQRKTSQSRADHQGRRRRLAGFRICECAFDQLFRIREEWRDHSGFPNE
jgi:hypothetical protein